MPSCTGDVVVLNSSHQAVKPRYRGISPLTTACSNASMQGVQLSIMMLQPLFVASNNLKKTNLAEKLILTTFHLSCTSPAIQACSLMCHQCVSCAAAVTFMGC